MKPYDTGGRERERDREGGICDWLYPSSLIPGNCKWSRNRAVKPPYLSGDIGDIEMLGHSVG